MLAGNLASIGVGGIIATATSYIVGCLPVTRNLIWGTQWLLLDSGRKISTLTSPGLSTHPAHDTLTNEIPLKVTRTKRRARRRSMQLLSRTTKQTRNSILLGCRRRSGSRLGVPLHWLVRSPSRRVLSDTDGTQTVVMIILIPLPLFFSSTVYGVAGLSGKSAMIIVPCRIRTLFSQLG